jgi:hypothetical protein
MSMVIAGCQRPPYTTLQRNCSLHPSSLPPLQSCGPQQRRRPRVWQRGCPR